MLLLKLLSGISWSQFGNYLFCAFALGIDVTDAPTQDAIADSLIAPLEATTEAAEENPVEETVVEDGEAEPTENEEAETTELAEDVADDWLPTETEKVFPPEILEKYAPRYGYTAEELQADPRLARLVQDKLNSDIYINQLRQKEETAELEAEAAPKTEPTRQPEQLQPQVTPEQHFNNIRTMVQQRTDPKIALEMFTGFGKLWGMDDAAIASTLKTNPNAAMDLASFLGAGAINLFNTFLPDMVWANLQNQIEQAYPEFGGMYQKAAYANTWDSVRTSNPQYSALPNYGTKEFGEAARKAATEQFGSPEDFENAIFTKVVNGQRVPMTQAENTQKKYSILASAMMGRKTDPAVVQKAIETGKKQATRAAVKRDAGNLGSGRSKQQISTPAKDDPFADGMDLYRQEHGRL